MKKEHKTFITNLLKNPKLSNTQKNKIFELVLRETNSNGSQQKILNDLRLIKKKMGIQAQEEDNATWKEVLTADDSQKENMNIDQKIIDKWYSSKSSSKEDDTIRKYLDEKVYTSMKVKTNSEDKNSEYRQKESLLPKYINPAPLSKFLIAYNQDPVLKYTCHEIDDIEIIKEINTLCGTEKYDLKKHQELVHKSYKNLEKYHYAHTSIKNLILVYLTGTSYTGKFKTWSTENIKINWNSPELLDWAKNNPGIVPNPGENLANKIRNRGFKLKKGIPSELSGERITSFSGLVIHFKHLFHIKGDNPLKTIIKRINKREEWLENIHFQIEHEDFWENLELFTDVDRLIQAYRAVIKIILDSVRKFNLDKPCVHLIFKEEKNNIIFSIHHQNTYYRKTINNTLERIGESQSELIKNQINGLCDLYLRANFGHSQFAEINLWDGNPREEKKINRFQGVQYILKFSK